MSINLGMWCVYCDYSINGSDYTNSV